MLSLRARHGFTLIEMLVVLAILGALTAIAMPVADLVHRRSREAELRVALRQIRDGLDAFKKASDEGRVMRPADGSGYPQQLSDLVQGVEDQRSPTHQKLYFLRLLPRDPLADDSMADAADTWALRCYDSPPDHPEPGRDVYDIHSKSTQLAIDGTGYSTW